MKKRRIRKVSALLMTLVLLLGIISAGTNEDASGTQEPVYSDWLRLDGLAGSEESQEPSAGTRDLRALLRGAALLDADGSLLAEGDVWPAEDGTARSVRLRFGETPGDAALQFDPDGGPLVYRLPDGLSAGEKDLTLPVRIALGSGGTADAVCVYSAAGRTLSLIPNAEMSEKLRAAEDASFEAVIPAVIADTDTLAFSDRLTVSLLRTEKRNRTAGSSSDLADFLDSIEIAGAQINEQGQYVILDGVPYTIQMNFSEKINGLQFDDDPEGGALVYHFPRGFTPNHTEGTVEMTGDGGVVRFDFVISGNTMTVVFDKTSPGYSSFITSETAQFEIHVTGLITEEEVAFSSEVSGEFDIDDTRDVQVQKIGTYDPDLNRVKFTVQASSRGNNTNIHIGDIITGTALTYDPASLTVSSNVSSPVQYSMDTRSGETFGLTIPAMAHGEVVTVEYWADIDLSSLTDNGNGRYGTVEETGNSVHIVSNEDPPGDDTTIDGDDFVNKISLSSNSKAFASQTVHDGKTYITWTVVLNEDANISIAGSTVTDIIDAASQPFMRYAGQGIHIERYRKDGTPAGSSDVRWGTNGLTPSGGGSSWTYTIPSSDEGHAYRYVITYETEVDSEAFLKPTTVSNTVHNEYDTDHGAVSVETTGEEVEAEKTVVQSTVDAEHKQAETEWEITFTVPAAGLDSAVIEDSLPAFLDYTQNRWFYDAYKNGSVRVKDGDLLAGEAFSVDATSQEHRVIITFTKDNGQPGLTGTGLTRTIHVYLTTEADHDWLVFAETNSRARTHVNNAVVRLNGQDIAVTAQVSYNTTAYELEKLLDGTYATSTDPALPIYVYKIILTNVNDNAFDENGCLTITDQYDAGYLTYLPTYQTTDGYNVNTPNGHVYGNTQWNKYGMVSRGPYVVEEATADGRLVFTLHKNDLPMFQSSYYPYYAIVYALQIKDAETLARMKEEALHNDGLKVELANIAGNEQFGTNTIITDFTVEALEKELLWEEDNSGTGTHDLHFSIRVNKDGLRIGDEDTITVKDTLSSLSFDYTSIEIEPRLGGDILNRVGNSIIFTLHNETPYTITYTARLIGIHDVHWNNRAELFGHISGLSGTSSSEAGGSGSYKTYGMNIKKYAEGNMNEGLAATFELYEARTKDADGHDIPDAVWRKIGEFTTDETTGVYQIRTVIHEGVTEALSLRPYSYHDADGHELFGGDGSESYGWRYRVVETVPPEGYQMVDVAYEFGISDIPSYVAPYTYLNNDTVTIVNKPVPAPVRMEITGTKVLRGRELQVGEFMFTLAPEESAAAAWGEAYPGGFEESLLALNERDGRFGFKLTFTYDDYVKALQKGFADEDNCAYFYYVVTESVPEEAEDYFWNNIIYDASRFLAVVKLSVDGGQLRTETACYRYDGNGIPEELQVRQAPRPPQDFLGRAR